ncbi:MAG: hydantoinase/oxoprolinase family protein [Deltaproteobacteria bacterium]|nr:hydantoinase/oxoprolinase family protein [Deltaproteobacteria bacterium]MDZ4342462.1 hydantoinase/oxoprolinase family protein [Candidatus Binatia bacterium]
MRIAVDIGGTFTDLVAVDDQGQIYRSKSLTTPDDLARGILDCLNGAKIDASQANFFVHGSTVTINAVLERKGARTGLITTEGFRDVYEIGRGNRPEGYNLFFKRPVPLVPRDLRLEVDERLYATGEVLKPLDEQSADATIGALKAAGVESIAVCLLHAYANPVHERRLGELLRQRFADVYVSLSHEILREFREYERTSTTALNSYVGPLVSRYLVSLEKLLGEGGFKGTFRVMQSNGGLMSAETAKKMPVTMMESGPVAGVIAAASLGESLDCRHIISFDMGGTTAKASLIKDFHPEVTSHYYVGGYVSGHPMMLPVVDIVEVGNGGGSIAWIDPAGGLKVGPQSAGAAPGPACYGQGGTEPTVTDANLIVGRVDPEYFLGSGIRLRRDHAAAAITEKIAKPLGMSLEEAALGILTIANFNMSLAVRAVSVEKGYDPRDCVLVPSGGGGALHAMAIARELSVPRVIIPPMPAHFSAFGMLLADLKHDYVQTFVRELSETTGAQIAGAFAVLEKSATDTLREEGAGPEQILLRRFLDMRYRGQEYTLPVPVMEDLRVLNNFDAIRSRFDQLHQEHYGHSAPKEPVMMVNLRLSALGRLDNRLPLASVARDGDGGERGKRPVIFDGAQGAIQCPILLRSGFKVGDCMDGPAVIEEVGATILLYPGDKMQVNEFGHLVIEVGS